MLCQVSSSVWSQLWSLTDKTCSRCPTETPPSSHVTPDSRLLRTETLRVITMAAVEVSALPSSSLPVESKILDVLPLQDVARCESQ